MSVLQEIDRLVKQLITAYKDPNGLQLELRKIEIDQLSSDKTMHLLAHRYPTGSVTVSFYYSDKSRS